MKNRGLYLFKWGLNFNEGGYYKWIPFCLAINYMNLAFFLYVYYPWFRYDINPLKDTLEKEYMFWYKKLFSICIYKKV